MKRIASIENYLQFFANIYKENQNISINEDSIYYYLTRDRETNKAILPFHKKWINDFKNAPNISVFVNENWQYFCQFVNANLSTNSNNELKLYIPVDAMHIDKAAHDIFNYLIVNNIKHISKIGSDERRDNIVIRLQNEKDLESFRNFIHQNKNIKDGLIENNPFVINDGIIGYAADGNLSYNSIVSKYIKNYLIEKRETNNLDNVSYQDFFLYCSNIYNRTFYDGNNKTIQDFMAKFNIIDTTDKNLLAKNLNNHREVSKLLLISLQTNSLDKYKEHVENIKDSNKTQLEIDKIKLTIDPKLSPIKQYIEVMIRKYGYDQAMINIDGYIKTRNPNLVTRDYNLRNILSNYSQKDLVDSIEIVSNLLKINENKKILKTENTLTNTTDIIEKSAHDTVKKLYNPTNQVLFQQIVQKYISVGLKQILDNNDYSAFTKTNNARDNMMSLNSDIICAELIKNAILIFNVSNKEYFTASNTLPTTGNDAITFIMNIVNDKGPTIAYQTIIQFPNIRNLLIDVYANFLSTTTSENRKEFVNMLSSETKDQLKTLNNLQKYLTNQNCEQDNYSNK